MNLRAGIQCAIFLALVILPARALAQSRSSSDGRASAAFAEVLVRKTELLADAEALGADYTDTNPKILDLRHEVAELDKSLKRILAAPAADQSKLTLALGKLMVKRASLDTDFFHLSRTLNPDHTDYKRAKKRLEIFDAAIKEILP